MNIEFTHGLERVMNCVATRAIFLALGFFASPGCLMAQGVATSTIRGTIRSDDGIDLNGVSVLIVNGSTGVRSSLRVSHGRFLLQGLEVGGPYVVEVRRIGFVPQRTRPFFLTLGEPAEVDIKMQRTAVDLDTVVVATSEAGTVIHSGGGVATTIPDSLLHR